MDYCRSYSNQFLKKKDKSSPKIDKKSKNKKSKSSSKLYDLKNEDPVTDETETSSKENTPPALPMTRYENKHFTHCLEEYKQFYVSFIKVKVLPHTDIQAFFKQLIYDKQQRINELKSLLDSRLTVQKTEFTPVHYNRASKLTSLTSTALAKSSSIYENAMGVASNILLEFCAFPNLLSVSEKQFPFWLEALIASACCPEVSRETQLTAMTTLLEIFGLSKNQNYLNEQNGILEHCHVFYIEDNTLVIEVSLVATSLKFEYWIYMTIQEMSKILWTLLGVVKNQNQLMLCVTLLYQIHNTFDTKLFVEQVIGQYLCDQNVTADYMKQFFTLWHLGRDLNVKLPPYKSSNRSFDR